MKKRRLLNKLLVPLFIILAICGAFSCNGRKTGYAVAVSANMEWKAVKKAFPGEKYIATPWGEYFFRQTGKHNVLFFHEGWGKVSAAGATQYLIDRFDPEVIINLGTCGGFEGSINRYDIVLADTTVIYDIVEAMGDSKEAIADYSAAIDLSWLKGNFPFPVIKTRLVSADRDLKPADIEKLKSDYRAVAGDWESGAMAYVAKRNNKKIIILRGVSDLVSPDSGEAYGNFDLFVQRTDSVMQNLLNRLPGLLDYLEGCK